MTHTFPDGALQELKFGEDPNQKLVIYYYKGIVQIAFNTPPPDTHAHSFLGTFGPILSS